MALSDNSLTYIHKDGHDMLRALFLLLLLLRNPDLPQLPAHPELRTAVQVWMGLGSASRWLPLVSTDLHVLNCVLEKRLPSATWGGKKNNKKKKKKNTRSVSPSPLERLVKSAWRFSANDGPFAPARSHCDTSKLPPFLPTHREAMTTGGWRGGRLSGLRCRQDAQGVAGGESVDGLQLPSVSV